MAYFVGAAFGAAYYGYKAASTVYHVGSSCVSAARGVYNGYQWVSSALPRQSQITNLNHDPISTLVIVSLLPFKESDSRIGLHSSGIVLQQPSEYLQLQGVWRALRGDSREDLFIVKEAIQAAARIFRPDRNEEISRLFEHAKGGLEALERTYKGKSEVTCDALKHWKELMTQAQEGSVDDYEEELEPTARKIQNLWIDTELNTICNLLDIAKRVQNGLDPDSEMRCQPQVTTIETYIAQKAIQFTKLLEEQDDPQ